MTQVGRCLSALAVCRPGSDAPRAFARGLRSESANGAQVSAWVRRGFCSHRRSRHRRTTRSSALAHGTLPSCPSAQPNCNIQRLRHCSACETFAAPVRPAAACAYRRWSGGLACAQQHGACGTHKLPCGRRYIALRRPAHCGPQDLAQACPPEPGPRAQRRPQTLLSLGLGFRV